MINYIEAELNNDKSLIIKSSPLIEGENLSNILKIKIAEDYACESSDYLVEFQLENNKRYTSEPLSLVDGYINYTIPSALLIQVGVIYIQVVIKSYDGDDVITVKSTVNGQLYVSRAINASERITLPKSVIDELLKTVADLKQFVNAKVLEINELVGDISALLDEINGEVVE